MRDRLTVVFGKSGLGKTSLLQAGLAPLLRNDGLLPILIRMEFSPGAPGWVEQIKPKIDAQLAAHEVELEGWTDSASLRDCLQSARFWSPYQELLTPVIILDQFEEIFTLGKDNPRADEFAHDLSDLVERPRGARVKLVLSLREDYLADLEAYRKALPSVALNRFRLAPMNGVQASAAVLGTGGPRVDESVAHYIVRHVAVGEGAAAPGTEETTEGLERLDVEPAMLGLFCRELDIARQERGVHDNITVALVDELKGSAYANFYERLVATQDPSVSRFIEDELLTEDGYRTTRALAEAERVVKGGAEALRELEDERLLRIEQRLGQPHVEIIHDVLIPKIKARGDKWRTRRNWEKRFKSQVSVLVVLMLAFAGWQWWVVSAQKDEITEKRNQVEIQRNQATASLGDATAKLEEAKRETASAEAARADAEGARAKALADREKAESEREQAREDATTASEAAAQAKRDKAEAERQYARAKVSEEQARQAQVEEQRLREQAETSEAAATKAKDEATRAKDDLSRQLTTTRAVEIAAQAELAAVTGGREPAALAKSLRAFDMLASARPDSSVVASLLSALAAAHRTYPLRGHEGPVLHADLSSDGTKAVTAGADGTVRVWTAPSWRQVLPSDERPAAGEISHTGQVWHTEFSPNGRMVVSVGQDGAAWLWSVDPPREPIPLRRDGMPLFHAEFSPDGRHVVTAGADGEARVFSVDDPRAPPRVLRHEREVWHAEFSPDGTRLVTASSDDTARIWDWLSGESLGTIPHDNAVRYATFSSDGGLVVSAGDDGAPRVWDAASGGVSELQGSGALIAHATVHGVESDLNRVQVVTAQFDGTARLWSFGGGAKATLIHVLRGHRDWVRSAVFSQDGREILTAGADGDARLWTWDPDVASVLLDGHTRGLRWGALARDDPRRAITASDDETARVWTLPADPQADAGSERMLGVALFEYSSDTSDELRIWMGSDEDTHDSTRGARLFGHRAWVWRSLLDELTGTSRTAEPEDGERREWTLRAAELRLRAEQVLGRTPATSVEKR